MNERTCPECESLVDIHGDCIEKYITPYCPKSLLCEVCGACECDWSC